MGTCPTRDSPRPSSWHWRCRRPLLLEGEAGVGKTELAKVLAAWTGGELIRLQCYEGIDAAQAVYDWDYARQLLHLRAAEATRRDRRPHAPTRSRPSCTSERFLVKRALLRAIEHGDGPAAGAADRRDRPRRRRVRGLPARGAVRLPDHRARARRVPRPSRPPIVVLTSNRTRDVHDALKRRCLYHWVEHPELRPRGRDRPPACARRAPTSWPARSRPRSRRCATSTSTSRPASPRRSTGRRRSAGSASPSSTSAAVATTLGTVLKYREDHQRVEQHGLADIVKQAFERGMRPG